MNIILISRLDDNSSVGNKIEKPLVLLHFDGGFDDVDTTDSEQAEMFINYMVTINGVNRKPRDGSLILFADKKLGTLTWGDGSCTVYVDEDNTKTFESD